MDSWVQAELDEATARIERDVEALVAVSSPSGDPVGAEECVAVAAALSPPNTTVERLPCSTPGYADDLLISLVGSGRSRLLLLGHLDTVIGHADHRPLTREGDRLLGPGSIDMKGGDALAIAVLHALSRRTSDFADVALLLVTDEEWRSAPFAHAERFAGWDACLCFEAGELAPDGSDAVIVSRKAAGTLRIEARGRAAHSGSEPERGRNALLALATAAQMAAAASSPEGPDHLTVVPTTVRCGEAFNIVPPHGELFCDLRSDRTEAFERVRAGIPKEIDGVRIDAEMVRAWPAMDTRAATRALLADASERLQRPIVASGRGGASDASHLASVVPVTIDGLGPRGGAAHDALEEHLLVSSIRARTELALTVTAAVLERLR